MPYDPNAYASAMVGNRKTQLQPGNNNIFNESLLQYQQLYPWLGTGLASANRLSIPSQPGIPSEKLDDTPPNADDTVRTQANQNKETIVNTKTSNLVTCPNAEGEVSLGCWLFSSDNDRAARRGLEQDTMPGEKEPKEIMVVPGNWMELQSTVGASQSYTHVTADLYNQETLASEQRIFTGVMVNSNTGEMYETYEDDVPPPNTDRNRILPEELSIQNPILTALSGGWDPDLPTRHKTEVLEVEYGDDAGLNPWGNGLYATAIRDNQEQRNVTQEFNNRNGFVPIEPAWDRRAVGFVGHVSAYRSGPYMPPTQREAREGNDGTVSTGGMSFPDTVTAVQNEAFDRPAERAYYNPQTDSFGNRGSQATIHNGSMANSNLAPGRIDYSAMSMHETGPYYTTESGQIYVPGEVQLRTEAPGSFRSPQATEQAVQRVSLMHGTQGTRHHSDTREENGPRTYGSHNTTANGINREFLANVRLVQEDPSKRAENRRQQGMQVSGAMDGRPADEAQYLASVKVVTDARQVNVLDSRSLNMSSNGAAAARTSARVAFKPDTSSQSTRSSMASGMVESGGNNMLPEYSSHVTDRSGTQQFNTRAISTGENDVAHPTMRPIERGSWNDNQEQDRFRPQGGEMPAGSIGTVSFGSSMLNKKSFGEALPRLQPSFGLAW